MEAASKPHALLLASPGTGHVIPVLELAHRLSSSLDFHVTVFLVPLGIATSAAESDTIRAAVTRGTFDVTELPPPVFDETNVIEPDADPVAKLAATMRAMRLAVRAAACALAREPTVLIVDLFGTELLSVAEEIGVAKTYIFVATHAWFLSLVVYLPVLDEVVEGEYVDQKEPLKIPGCRPVRPDEVLDPMQNRSSQQYREVVRIGLEMPTSDGILVNTWEELQGDTLAALNGEGELGRIMKVPVYPIGPIIRLNGLNNRPSRPVFEWLDRQPERSVVYVCLGSGGTMSFRQTTEMAWGLELSGQRFLWVIRRPADRITDRTYFAGVSSGGVDEDDVANFLPEGFMGRAGERCLVVQDWAQQAEILGHVSVGGFLSHCGWNSTMESLSNGIPMVTWPLYAEQRMNSTMLTEEFGVAVRPGKFPTAEEVIGREEIAAMVRKVMEDDEIRNRAREIKILSEQAWSDGGSSRSALFEWSKRCRTVS